MKKRTVEDYAKALDTVTDGVTGAALKISLKAFAELLYRHGQVKRLGAILVIYEKYARERSGVVSIAVTTARAIDKKTLAEVKKIFGDHVESTETVDESILGGVLVRTDEAIFDASLSTQIRRLENQLI